MATLVVRYCAAAIVTLLAVLTRHHFITADKRRFLFDYSVMMNAVSRCACMLFLGALVLLVSPQRALAVKASVKTVPWVATDRLIPHETWSGKQITLKGTSDI